jgi:hypothetical protein
MQPQTIHPKKESRRKSPPTTVAASAEPTRVTVDNFRRAETDTYFARFAKEGAFGRLNHARELTPLDEQNVIRMNRDTLYSFGVFDLDASSVTLTLPDAGHRYQAAQIVNGEHYVVDVLYAPATYTLTKDRAGTRYACIAVRTFVNPNDPADVNAVHALQDAIRIEQETKGSFDEQAWDQESLHRIREALLALSAANGELDSHRMFGRKDEVDPVQHLLGTAAGWGGNPASAALYAGTVPAQNDGKTPYRLTLKDVPVDGFWSVSVYNESGFFEPNAKNAYSVNDVTAKRDESGAVRIHFGGDERAPNYLPIMPGWNYLLRMYRPREELLDGTWQPPQAEPLPH